MRLDKFLTVTGTATRSESKKAARAGDVTVNGVTVKDTSVQINEETDTITFRGAAVIYQRFTSIRLIKNPERQLPRAMQVLKVQFMTFTLTVLAQNILAVLQLTKTATVIMVQVIKETYHCKTTMQRKKQPQRVLHLTQKFISLKKY